MFFFQKKKKKLSRFDLLCMRENWDWEEVEAAVAVDRVRTKKPAAESHISNGDGLRTLEGRAFVLAREEQVQHLMALYKRELRYEGEVSVTWSKRLNKTAGLTKCMRKGQERRAVVELATKVVDTTNKLRCTLAHEMAHALAWLVDNSCKPPHGEVFKKWARLFETKFGCKISTCHSYEINFKYEWTCQGCEQVIQRHSKSFDVDKFKCGACQGKFVRTK